MVLIPLEFFSLFFLKHIETSKTDKEERLKEINSIRHSLISTGCLDVATLLLLLLIANEDQMARLSMENLYVSRYLATAYLLALWFISFISSFQIIYKTQYAPPDPPTPQPAPPPGRV